MAELPEGTVATNEQGDLIVWRNGEWTPTTRQALDTGPVEAAAVGAGEVFQNIGRTLGIVDEESRAEEEALLAPMQAERPISTGVGAALPFVAAGAATGGSGVLPMLGAEAALGAAAARPGERLQGAAFGAGGAALGLGAGTVLTRTIARNAARSGRAAGQVLDQVDEADAILQAPGRAAREAEAPRLTRAQRRAQAFDDVERPPPGAGGSAGAMARTVHATRVGQADDLGFALSTGERLNNDTLRQVEAGFRSSPFAPSHLREIRAGNQINLNRKWGEAIGVGPVDNITDDVLGAAVEGASDTFAQAADIAKTVDTRGLARRLGRIREGRGPSLLQEPMVDNVVARIDELSQVGPGGMNARDFMALRSNINKQMRQASTQGQGLLVEAMQDVLDAMDETFEASAGEAAAALYRGAREQWRFITALERGQAINPATGNVNARSAGTSLRRVFKHEAGRGNLDELSEGGAQAIEANQVATYFGDIVGDSGTATRLSVAEFMRNPIGSSGGLVTRGMGEAYNRIVAPVMERAAQGQGRGLMAPPGATGIPETQGPFPLDL
jgi:hypothetical protein